MTRRDQRSNTDIHQTGPGPRRRNASQRQREHTQPSNREANVAVTLIFAGIILFFGARFGPVIYFAMTGQGVDAILFGIPWMIVFGLTATVLGGG